MISYRPINLAQSSPPAAAAARSESPGTLTNLLLVGSGALIGTLSFPYRKKALGFVGLASGGAVAGAGIIFLILDGVGKAPPPVV